MKTLDFHNLAPIILERMRSASPCLVGITGGVGVGKSTFARQFARYWWEHYPNICLGVLPTDGYIYPYTQLVREGLLARKGFPESYDRDSLCRDLQAIRRGECGVEVPVYAHHAYDRLETAYLWIQKPDILLVEGLLVDQGVRECLDFLIYIDMPLPMMRARYVARSLRYRAAAQQGKIGGEHFRCLAEQSEEEALARIEQLWSTVNEENRRQHILPFRAQADVILSH